jgi:hypothetical protein
MGCCARAHRVPCLGELAITATQALWVLQHPLSPSTWICQWDKILGVE